MSLEIARLKKVLLFLIWLGGVVAGSAQQIPGTLEGFIVKVGNNEPLEGANVVLVGTEHGDATDKNGFFKIETVPPGEYQVAVQLIGYQTVRLGIRITPREALKLNFMLEPKVLKGTEVRVEAERVDDIRLEITRPTFELRPQEIQAMAGAQEDVMRSILSLPGVQATSDFSNQFIVRGGGPDQNLILLDDIEIYNPYRNSGMPSLINPNVIQNVNLYAGGYPALFGDRLSSVLTVHSREGSSVNWLNGSMGANLTHANLLLEGKLPFLKGSWFFSNRRSYNQLFAESWSERLTPNDVALPDFQDWHVKVALHPNPAHKVQVHGLRSRNNQDFLVKEELGEQDSERENLDGQDRVQTNVLGGSWSYLPSTAVQMKLHANWYENTGRSSFAGDFVPGIDQARQSAGENSFGGVQPVFSQGDSTFLIDHRQRFDFSKISFGGWLVINQEKHAIESGFGVDFLKNSITSELQLSDFGEVVFDALRSAPNFFGALADSSDQKRSYQRAYFYVQDKWTVLDDKLMFQPGLRFDYYDLIDRGYVSPRLRISYQVDPITIITAAGGIYRQSPGFEKLLDGGQV
ncbi:TonB-dependent receptor, partial [bacterium]|nr:TonB-dependent receptor [bacterium]